MKIHFNSIISDVLTQEQLLMKKIEIAQIKKQIDMIATFLPDEVLRLSERDLKQTQRYVGIVMLIQITGFTTLTERYNKIGKGGIYKLTATLNAYLGSLIEMCHFYGGDILKFGGELLLTIWKLRPDSTISDILHEVIVCALALQQLLGNFETEINVTLQLKISITCGNISFAVIHGDYNVKNYFVIGDAITESQTALGISNNGDVVVGPRAWSHICHKEYETSHVDGFVKMWKIYYSPNEASTKKFYDDKQIEVIKLIEKHIALRSLLHSRNKFESSLTMSKLIDSFMQSLPARKEMRNASKYWRVNELRPFIIQPIQDQVDESQPVEYLTDMREVTVQCIKLLPNMLNDTIMITLQEAYKVICDISSLVLGSICKVMLLDKNVMIIIIFGLKSVRHEFESQNALRSGFEIKKALMEIIGIVQVSVAVTLGFVYCGVIGHPLRREYVIIGSTYNRAVKMTNMYVNAVSCDRKTFNYSKLSSFYFHLLPTSKMSDHDDLGQIFEYNETLDAAERAPKPAMTLYGRDDEFNLVRAIIHGDDYVKGVKGICFDAKECMGASAIMNYCYHTFSEVDSYNLTSINLTSATSVPYFCISKLYSQLYDNRTRLFNDDVQIILNLPRSLEDQQGYSRLVKDDVAIRKYQILKCFRDIILCSGKITIIFIDNFHNMDLQSWEILDIISSEQNFRLVATSSFRSEHLDLKFKLALNDNFKIIECLPLGNKYIAGIACYFLKVKGIPKHLVKLLIATCEGRPGYVKNCLLRLINSRAIEFKMLKVSELDQETYVFPEIGNRLNKMHQDELVTIVTFSHVYKNIKHEVLTIASIALDLYDSLPSYHRLVVKTASVLGELFIRTLLIVALKYPSETALANVIQLLFEDNIFDCGSKYVNASKVRSTKTCCVCYFEPDYFTGERKSLPKYAYCKIIYFKNQSIRRVAYDLVPDNQKKELHLMCTEVLEHMTHFCPKCIREPNTAFVNFGYFKEVVASCGSALQAQNVIPEQVNLEEIKDAIREGIYSDISNVNEHTRTSNACNCLEILSRNFKGLIYHSESAGHMAKTIFFTMGYGLCLIALDDYQGAIDVLTIARELCMNDTNAGFQLITESFRRLHMGKINYGLAKAFTDLRQLNTAKNYLAIALRQYNIPSVAMNFKSFKMLLCRSYLVNTKRMKPLKQITGPFINNDLGACLSLCGKVFYLEGKWDLSKLCCAYSIFIMKTMNPRISILFEVYCNAMDVYKHCDHAHTCERLVKYIKRDLQTNYANNNTHDFNRVYDFLNSVFHIKLMSGDICGAIRLGYRILDITLQFFTFTPYLDTEIWLVKLLIFNFRLHDSLIISALFRHNIHATRKSFYYIMSLMYILRTGFYFETITTIIDFAKTTHGNKTKEEMTATDYLFYSVIMTYYMSTDKYQLAKEWEFEYDFRIDNTCKEVELSTLMYTMEARVYLLLRSIRHGEPVVEEMKQISRYLELIDFHTGDQYKIYRPLYYIYKAWFCRIKKKNRDANNFLKKARLISEKQENWLFKCWTDQIEYGWDYAAPKFDNIPEITAESAIDVTQLEWTRLMRTLPLE